MKLALALMPAVAMATGCIGDTGAEVDWFTVFKHPNGYDYSYLDSRSKTMKVSGESLDSKTDGAIAYTLHQVYDKGESLFYNTTSGLYHVDHNLNSTRLSGDLRSHAQLRKNKDLIFALYNDQDPNNKQPSYDGHSKGIIGFDEKKGFWLIHSMPKWPPFMTGKYKGLPDKKFGQTFICVTYKISELEKIAKDQMIARPQVYDFNVPKDLKGKFPNFEDLIDKQHTDGEQVATKLKSAGGVEFTHLVKSGDTDIELYEDLVASKLSTDLNTETWQNGGHLCGSFCKSKGYDHDVQDIQTLKFGDDEWTTHQDHSKWAVSTGSKKWACIGDINRETTQYKRGGGTLCTNKLPALTKAMKAAIQETDEC